MQRFVSTILRHRALTLTAVFTITCGCAWYIAANAVIATSLSRMFMGDNPDFARLHELADDFGNDEVLIFGFPYDNPLSPERSEPLLAAIDEILTLQDVQRVDSIYNAQEVRTSGGMLKVKRYAREATDDPERIPELFAAMQSDRYIRGTLLSQTGRHIAIIVELTPNIDRPAERGPELITSIQTILHKAGVNAKSLHKAGLPAVVFEVIEESKITLLHRFPFITAALLVIVLLLFRGILPVVVTGGVCLLAVIWTVAFSVAINPQISVMLAMVPAVVLIVGFSDVVHLYSAYLLELADGYDKHTAITRSAADVGRACLYTSVTTFVGFMCLSLVPTPMFRQLGFVLGFGVAVALLIAVTAMPVLLSLLPAPKQRAQSARSGLSLALGGFLRWLQQTSTQRPVVVAGIWAVVLCVSVGGIVVMEVETDLEARMEEGSVVRVDQDFFKKHFSGSATMDIYLHAQQEGGALDPEFMAKAAAFQRDLKALPEIDDAVSLIDLMRRIHRELAEVNDDSLPTSRNAFAQYLLLFEMGGGTELQRLIDFDRRTLRLSVRLGTTGFREARAVGQRVEAIAADVLGDKADIEVTGHWYLMGSWLDEILAGQARGLGLSFAIIALMMMLVAGSARIGLWSMLPNLMPLLVLGGYVGLAWPKVDSDTLAVAMLAIGIGVDDTIHFLSRYRTEAQRTANESEAIGRTFDFAGRAIVMTTVILVVGFLPNATSTYFSTQIMGTLLPMTLVIALLADLTLVPALITLGPMRAAPTGTNSGYTAPSAKRAG